MEETERPVIIRAHMGACIVSHIDEIQKKIVVLRSDAPVLYDDDPRWKDEPEDLREIGTTLLRAIMGRKLPVMAYYNREGRIFYQLPVSPIVLINHVPYDQTILPAEYFEVLQSGFMVAK